MKTKISLPIVLVLVAAFISSCTFQIVMGSGNVVSEDRSTGDFSAVTLAGIGDVIITQADETSVRIEAEDNFMQYFETVVRGDTLEIGIKDAYTGIQLRPTRPVKFSVSTPKLNAVTLAGSGNIITSDVKTTNFKVALLGSGNISNDSLVATDVTLKLSGSGNIDLGQVTASEINSTIAGSGNITLSDVTAKTVDSTIAGSGDIRFSGEVTSQTVKIVGSGDYLTSSLKSDAATLNVTGSGNSRVWVTSSLNVSILGSGDVYYTGTPAVNTSIAGSGRVRGGN